MDYHIDNAKLVLKKNGKSFYWAGKFLPKECINRAAELYSFCRILDDIADNVEINSLKDLKNIRSNIKTKSFRDLEKIYSIKYPKFLNSSSKKVVIDLIDGLILDQKAILFKKEEELIRYSYHVAGTVGIMMCDALKCDCSVAKSFAIDLGIAMQLTNIARDVLEDAKMGRRYLPGIWIQNISPKEIVLAAKTNDLKKIHIISKGVKKLLILAEQYYFSGERGFTFLPFKTRVAISIASGVYREIGVQLENENYNWQNGRQITSIYTKIKISLFKIFKEIFYFRLKKRHNPKLHIFLEHLVDDK